MEKRMEFSDSTQEMSKSDNVSQSLQGSGKDTLETEENGAMAAEGSGAMAAKRFTAMAAEVYDVLGEEGYSVTAAEENGAMAAEGYGALEKKDVAEYEMNARAVKRGGHENYLFKRYTADNESELDGGHGNNEGERDFTFQFDDDFGYLNFFQMDMEAELNDIAEESINAEPRYKYADDENKSFEEIAATMENLDENGYVKKKIVAEGSGETPPLFARALVHYDFYKEGFEEPFDSTYLRSKPCKIRLDESEIIPGLEIALKSMKKKESAKFMFKWEVAFGIQGCPPRIPKRCTVLAYVELVDFSPLVDKKNDILFTDGQYRLNTFARGYKDAKASHIEGNEEFAVRNIKGAIRCYRRCIALLNDLRLENVGEEKRMFCLKIKCLVNLSICYNRLNKPEQACVVARQALALDENNAKALYQYGKANLILSNLDFAEKWLKKAYNLKPDDVDILRELGKLNERKDRAKALDNLFCKRAFQFYEDEEDEKKKNDKGEGSDDAKK